VCFLFVVNPLETHLKMPATIYHSKLPAVKPLSTDLLTYLFSNPNNAPDTKPLYIDAVTGQKRTYGEVRKRTRSLASALRNLGLKPGDVVTLFSPNSIDYAINCFAIIGCGATVSPVSSAMNPTELRHTLETAQSKFIISHSALIQTARAAAQGTHVKLVLQIDGSKDSTGHPTTETLASTTPPAPLDTVPQAELNTRIVYIRAKGVITTHANLTANIQQWGAHLFSHLSASAPTIAFLPFSHIYGLNLYLCSYVLKATPMVVLGKFELELYLRSIQKYRPEDLMLVPPVLLALGKDPSVAKYDLSSLKRIMCGAAPMSVELARTVEGQLKKRYGKPVYCFEAWGMTESSPFGLGMPLDMLDRYRHQGIGTVASGMQMRLVDGETGKDVAEPKSGGGAGVKSEVGELWIAGPNVCAGYYRNEEATRDSFQVEDGVRWFKTGDIATIDSDGIVKIHDRSKEMFKYVVSALNVESQLIPQQIQRISSNASRA
jgi:acyl-CoA synthetase (AMP-forming)/AMP-acid ligase II